MPNTIRLRRGATAPTAGSFVEGEPAWDSTNNRLYVKNAAGSMVQIGNVTTSDTGTVTSTMIANNTIVDGDISLTAAIAGTKISPDFGAQNITTTGLISGDLAPSAGTTTVAPIKFTSGVNLTTAAAGAFEYDGTHFYSTPTTTSGRGQIPSLQTFRLTSLGANIGGTIADFYGATSSINLAASSVYAVEFFAFFQKNTAGTVTWTLTASSAPIVISGSYIGSPVAGIASGTPITSYTGSRGATTAAFAATASIANNIFMAFSIKVQVFTNLATTFKLQVTCGAGTVAPQAGSFYTVCQISGTTGSFA